MINYSRDPQQEIPSSAVKIVGLGGAGANMLERIALDSIEGAEATGAEHGYPDLRSFTCEGKTPARSQPHEGTRYLAVIQSLANRRCLKRKKKSAKH